VIEDYFLTSFIKHRLGLEYTAIGAPAAVPARREKATEPEASYIPIRIFYAASIAFALELALQQALSLASASAAILSMAASPVFGAGPMLATSFKYPSQFIFGSLS
jgi:hypothetical protein